MMDQALEDELARYQALLAAQSYAEAAALLLHIAEPLLHVGSTQTLLDLFNRLPAQERTASPQLLIMAGDAWRLRNNWQQAGTCYGQALRLAEAANRTEDVGLALCRQALLCWLRGDTEGAAELYERTARQLDAVDQADSVWDDLRTDYALALSSLGRLDEAEQLLQRQLRIFQRRSDAAGQRMILNNLGMMIYLRRGDFEAAEATLYEALRLAEEAQHRLGEAYVANSLAYTLNWQCRSTEAISMSRRAQALGEAIAVPNVIAFAYLNQAQARFDQGEPQAAERACGQALAALQSGMSSPLRCDVLMLQSELQRGRCLSPACRTAQAALAAARMQGDRWTTGLCLLQVAALHLDAAQPSIAQTALDQAQAIFEQYGDRYQVLRCSLLAARLAHAQQNWPELRQLIQTLLGELNHYPHLTATHHILLAEWLASVLRHSPESGPSLYDLAVAWKSAFAPVAAILLKHVDESVRHWAIGVLAAHAAPWAWAVLARHSEPAPLVQATIAISLQRAAAAPFPPLALTCLGAFAVSHADLPIPEDRWTSLHAQLVLVYLTLRGSATRDELIALLWPDDELAKTGPRLRTTIRLLRRTLCPPWQPAADYIVYENERYRIAPPVPVTSDVQHFQYWVKQAQRNLGDDQQSACVEALKYYGGAFLPGAFNDWVINQREQLLADWLWVQEEYAHGLLLNGRLDEAEQCARQLISADPFRERAWHALLHSLCRQGRAAEARNVYQVLVERLRAEFGVDPATETRRLAATLLVHSTPEMLVLAPS